MKKLRKSFGHAANGLKETLVHERNFKIMLGAAFFIVGAMFYLPTSRAEKAILATAIFAILTLEMVNIVIERLLDFLHPAHHEEVRVIKNLTTKQIGDFFIFPKILGYIRSICCNPLNNRPLSCTLLNNPFYRIHARAYS